MTLKSIRKQLVITAAAIVIAFAVLFPMSGAVNAATPSCSMRIIGKTVSVTAGAGGNIKVVHSKLGHVGVVNLGTTRKYKGQYGTFYGRDFSGTTRCQVAY